VVSVASAVRAAPYQDAQNAQRDTHSRIKNIHLSRSQGGRTVQPVSLPRAPSPRSPVRLRSRRVPPAPLVDPPRPRDPAPVPLQNLACAVDLRVRERSGSGMIVGRVLPTPLSDHGLLVSVAGDPCVPQVRGRCRATGVAARGLGLASPRQPATPLVARSSGSVRVGPAASATAADAQAG
jgi:hypothetical protein